ncbi:hypothetical protein SG34_009900 [Thalassomonas viridans]|uniref:Type VI secretion system effector TseH-like domain-containing protein n=1 Tax=Thalassomonas viridans TaxID=137584 RepID=A0AAF0CC73_9GAMM|nr:hypothetical protein [Thalassomonas viridans]WDE07169.1 hypothetical protein SG34_009900 [Thalassomonas viridans]
MPDLLIPIVFPDYIITVETPGARITIPDYLPYVDILPNEIRVPHTKNKISDLGHAGVLFINGKSGVTRYYEYGRYDPQKLGWVKKILNLPDVKVDAQGKIIESSLLKVLQIISSKAGKGGRISAAYIKADNKYEAMLEYAQIRMALNSNPNRERYDITSYSCVHFIKGVMDSAGIDTPWMFDPRPTSYIKEIQDDYPILEYDPSDNKLIIKESDSVFGF